MLPTLTLLPRENLPSCHDNIIQHLETQIYTMSAGATGGVAGFGDVHFV
jgi:hypothetical protein